MNNFRRTFLFAIAFVLALGAQCNAMHYVAAWRFLDRAPDNSDQTSEKNEQPQTDEGGNEQSSEQQDDTEESGGGGSSCRRILVKY